jgi:hypothetical protein
MRQARQIDGALGEMVGGQFQRTDQRPSRRHRALRRRRAPGPWCEPNGIGQFAQELVGVLNGRCLLVGRPGIEQCHQRAKGQSARLVMSELGQFNPMGGIRRHDALHRAAQARSLI